MTSFLISALLLLILVLLFLLRPFFFAGKVPATSRRQMNTSIYRDELDKLEDELRKMNEQKFGNLVEQPQEEQPEIKRLSYTKR